MKKKIKEPMYELDINNLEPRELLKGLATIYICNPVRLAPEAFKDLPDDFKKLFKKVEGKQSCIS